MSERNNAYNIPWYRKLSFQNRALVTPMPQGAVAALHSLEYIERHICLFYGTSPAALRSRCRQGNINEARKIMMFLANYEFLNSLSYAGSRYDRNHATALHAKRDIIAALPTCNHFRQRFSHVLQMTGIRSIIINDDEIIFTKQLSSREMYPDKVKKFKIFKPIPEYYDDRTN